MMSQRVRRGPVGRHWPGGQAANYVTLAAVRRSRRKAGNQQRQLKAVANSLSVFLAATALFMISPVTQSRLIQMTDGAPVALALNGSVFAMGQALGATMGGAALASFGVPAIPATALSMSLVALVNRWRATADHAGTA